MLHHVSVGVTDVERSARFYDLVLAALGYKRVMEFLPHAVAYGTDAPELWISLPHDQRPASVGNGIHIALSAPNERAVRAFHEAALAAGGSDEGGPGPRPEYTPDYFGAFVRDPDGNKLEAMVMASQAISTQAKRRATRKAAKRAPARKATAGKGNARKANAGKASVRRGGKKAGATRKTAANRGPARRGGRGRARKR